MLSVNFLKVLLYFLMRVSLLMGQFSVCSAAAFSVPLSCCSNSHSYIIWSTDCSPFLHEHVGLSIILYLYKYDLILPWPDNIVVKFGVTLIFSFNLSVILGKNSFVLETNPRGNQPNIRRKMDVISYLHRVCKSFYMDQDFPSLSIIYFSHFPVRIFLRYPIETATVLLPQNFNSLWPA